MHEALDSTSDRLLAVDDLPSGPFDACLAEFQSAGRGRRGRRWVAPFASGLCLSVGWSYRDAPAALVALSLAAGVAVLRALGRLGIAGLALKWPNDIVRDDSKLGGILIDLRGEAAGPAYVVVGVGVNVRLPASARERLAAEGVDAVDLAALGHAAVAQCAGCGADRGTVERPRRVRRARAGGVRAASGRTPMRSRDGPLRYCTAARLWRAARAAWTATAPCFSRSTARLRSIVSGEVSVRPVRC